MRRSVLGITLIGWLVASFPVRAQEPLLITRPQAHQTLVNPACSHCRDEARRRAVDLKPNDPVLCWIRGYSEGGAIPFRFFLNPYRVISDSYGTFVYDPEAGYARAFAPSFEFRFQGWRNGVMVMQHQDGTSYSCLSGVAFAGPRKGQRLQPVPALVSTWGYWLEHYPDAVAYHLYDKYQPLELSTAAEPDSLKSRGKADPRLGAEDWILGVWTGAAARAYPLKHLEEPGIVREQIAGEAVVLLWEAATRTAAAYRPLASPPRKYLAPRPDKRGISPPDDGIPIPADKPPAQPRTVTLDRAVPPTAGGFMDRETRSTWDIAGRCVAGELKGWTLQWLDSVQVKWLAWSAEYPETTIYEPQAAALPAKAPAGLQNKVKEVAGTAEFLRLLPKPFATLRAVDPVARTVTLQVEGEQEAKVWPVEPDAEVKVHCWWGRLEQFTPGQRVWAWLKLDRKKKPVSVVMLADAVSEYDLHGRLQQKPTPPPPFTEEQVEKLRADQRAWLRQRWTTAGLPGTLTFHHVFSGELEVMLDHEAQRWGRGLEAGASIQLTAEPPIKGVVKSVQPWRERTVVRLVVGELESSELKIGQRLGLKITPPAEAADASSYPTDMDRPRSRAERIEWFLASIYCTCGIRKDICTGHFYTLASCNPNGCGMPNSTRQTLAKLIDSGLTDRQIFDELRGKQGDLLLRPHLAP